MTTPDHPTHLDTIPAMQAAFKIGRAEYLRNQSVARALAALASMCEPAKPASEVVGGGASTTGKVRWLIENKPGITVAEICATIKQCQPNVARILTNLEKEGFIRFEKEGNARHYYPVKFYGVQK